MTDVKYPEIEVELVGHDGNAFAIIGKVRRALVENGVSKEEIDQYLEESQSGNYDNLLCVAANWVNVS